MMASFEETRLWQESLGQAPDGEQGKLLEKLRVQLGGFRENAGILAEEIARDLPYFTVHDLRHIDALWDISTEIAGDEVTLTPAEAFVLGGAFLVHDLGMASAAYPGGPAHLEELPAWKTAMSAVMRRRLGKNPSETDLADASEEDRREAMEALLRRQHAQQAESLVVEPVAIERKENREEQRYLIEHAEWRKAFGRLIGRVAHSHWWPIDRVRKEFSTTVNAPAGMPREWTIDPLKLACLLRAADAAHLDKLRAPSLLRLLRDPPGVSNDHWVFQGALDPPRLDGDHLKATSTQAFLPEDANAWWLCLDALRVADRELREVDALLADLHRDRFAARGVAGVDSPERLADLIPTRDWLPREAKIEVSDVARIIDSLGGEKLYGNQLAVPLRELIQNAGDAANLRRRLDGVFEPITVSLREGGEQRVLEVADFGSGMGPEVLTGALLDFGVSLWSSDSFVEEFPDAADFEPVGSFGIGFFSVFMWSDRVKVISRRFDAAVDDTYVLELSNGSSGRPLLRRARTDERRLKPGTTVQLELKDSWDSRGSVGYLKSFARVCGRVAPALSASLVVREEEEEPVEIVSGGDWLELPGIELLSRIRGEEIDDRFAELALKVIDNLRPIEGLDGKVAGRLALLPGAPVRELNNASVFTVGGLRSDSLTNIVGLLEGREPTAARNEAQMNASHEEIASWASDQALLLIPLIKDAIEGVAVANAVGLLGGDPATLPICRTAEGFLNFEELQQWAETHEEAFLLDLSEPDIDFWDFAGAAEPYEPDPDVIVLYAQGWDVSPFMRAPLYYNHPDSPVHAAGTSTLVEQALALGWGLDRRAEIYPEDPELELFYDGPPVPVGRVGDRLIEVDYVSPVARRHGERNRFVESDE